MRWGLGVPKMHLEAEKSTKVHSWDIGGESPACTCQKLGLHSQPVVTGQEWWTLKYMARSCGH